MPADSSVFTTLRWKEGRVAWLERHLLRLRSHAERLGIDWTQRAQLSGPTSPPDSGAAAVGMGSWGEFVMAKMDLPLYQVVIEALESDNQTKLLQEPQVTTFDNYRANINFFELRKNDGEKKKNV